eukprot:CAMPEP_0170573606 /NCGR_PEP_ID=MMETSP0224-20130122/2855_1 /TAXON_ID=285029 /ORGANISM="Togula jolla, Strain CCCM 725" /LENGTH=82 /DNA_ID=CAMNT_0010896205 /DNA_START=139 /DNA_END=387 /DNA_ORIENTATION=-
MIHGAAKALGFFEGEFLKNLLHPVPAPLMEPHHVHDDGARWEHTATSEHYEEHIILGRHEVVAEGPPVADEEADTYDAPLDW